MDFVNYNVEILNNRGRSAGPSNLQTVFLAPAMPPPANFSAQVASDAVVLSWQPPPVPSSPRLRTEYRYRILRSTQGAQPVQVTDVAEFPVTERTSYRDTNFDWERTYIYQIVGVAQVKAREDEKLLAEFIGEASPALNVTAHDTFPPVAPEGVQAVFAGAVDPAQNFIDLTWTPNAEADLAGYNVYRSVNSGAVVKINPTVAPTPSFRDINIAAGASYTYSVSAVDARGNESPHSQTAMEKVPAK
jgi:fibronectin type 3 domain-containing protein